MECTDDGGRDEYELIRESVDRTMGRKIELSHQKTDETVGSSRLWERNAFDWRSSCGVDAIRMGRLSSVEPRNSPIEKTTAADRTRAASHERTNDGDGDCRYATPTTTSRQVFFCWVVKPNEREYRMEK